MAWLIYCILITESCQIVEAIGVLNFLFTAVDIDSDYTGLGGDRSILFVCPGPDKVLALIAAIGNCRDRPTMKTLIGQCPQMASCNIVPYAVQHNQPSILGKLFVLSYNPTLQFAAGDALITLLLRLLYKSSRYLEDIRQLEECLRYGLSFQSFLMDYKLAHLFCEIYKLTVFAIILGCTDKRSPEKQRHGLSESLVSALRDMSENCCAHHPSMAEHARFHLGVTLDLLSQPWTYRQHGPFTDILHFMAFCREAKQTRDDRSSMEANILTRLADKKLTEPERCLLLHCFASAVHSNALPFRVYVEILSKELARAQKEKNKALLFSCALLCVEMAQFVSYPGRHAFFFDI